MGTRAHLACIPCGARRIRSAERADKSACLEMGYAESDVDWKLTAYCVQRDYRGVMKAIPLDELKNNLPAEDKT